MSFLPIRLSTLKGGIKLGFDAYIKLPHKMLMYVKGDYDLEQERIDSLKAKKVRKLFVHEDQEENYQEYIDRCLADAAENPNVSGADKAKIVSGAGEATAERIYDNPESKRSYIAAEGTSHSLMQVLKANDEILLELFNHGEKAENKDQDSLMHRHSVNTASLCISFGEFMQLEAEQVKNLGVAGLYHDVAYGKSNGDVKNLFFREMDQMALEEQKIYKTHPELGASYLQEKDFASPEVLDLIRTHEEKNQGNGFPQGLQQLSPVQEIISICAFYDRQLTCFGKKREEVFEDFSLNQLGNYDLNTIKKFKSFIKKSGL